MSYYSGPPYYYDYLNVVDNRVSPSTVHVQNTISANYFRKYLLQKAMSVFKWTMPETWDSDYFLYCLYGWGFIAIIDTPKFGVIPQGCGLSGYNVFYQPKKVVVANQAISVEQIERDIGKDAALIKLQPNYSSIMDIVTYYGDKMALAAEALDVSLLNSRMAYVFAAKNQTFAESMKKMMDKILSGEPAVVVDKKLFNDDGSPAWQLFLQNVGQNYISDKLLLDMHKIELMFDTEIGIPNTNSDKKERLTTDEVAANNVETFAKCELWLDTIRKGIRQAQDIFGDKLGLLSVDWRHDPEGMEVSTDGESNTVDSRTV